MLNVLRRLIAGGPRPAGEPAELCRFHPDTSVPSTTAGVERTVDGWRITLDGAGAVTLFEVPLQGVASCRLDFDAALAAEGVAGVSLQLLVRVPGEGESVSRDRANALRGESELLDRRVSFVCRGGQRPDRARLCVTFEGPGTARIERVRLSAVPMRG